MVKLIHGVGFNDRSCPTKANYKITQEYQLWKGMLRRCYCETYHLGKPTYEGCFVSENFKSYSYFFDWCQAQVGFNNPNFQLDKDLLVKGNQTYSEDLCVFIPSELNVLFTKRVNFRGTSPIGITYRKGRYVARLNAFGKRQWLGSFDTPDLAFQAYKTAKEAHIKDMAEMYKADIDPRAYTALMAYQVEITD